MIVAGYIVESRFGSSPVLGAARDTIDRSQRQSQGIEPAQQAVQGGLIKEALIRPFSN
jgi:hypothetical protein